jgi:hypothetical protein
VVPLTAIVESLGAALPVSVIGRPEDKVAPEVGEVMVAVDGNTHKDAGIYGDGLSLGPEGTELEGLHFCRVASPSCKSLAVSINQLQVIDSKMVARDGIEPPTPAFSVA